MRERFEDALRILRKAKLGDKHRGHYLHQLPWYIFIGPPASGKTTALVNSGLRFPLVENFGKSQEIQGIGGTRNCDWFFTDEAVLLDTAGRYVTQDTNQEVDSAAWIGFLELLKKYRRRRPINGALVAMSLADLAQRTRSELERQAWSIKQRMQELHEHLGIRFPVYVLFTKCDLIAGFLEFFDDLGREERAQVWGMTFELDEADEFKGAAASFGAEFDALEKRLNEGLLMRLQQEKDPRKRDLIYAFPQQFGSLKDMANSFLNAVFQPSRFEVRPLLRGIYFTSGTQEGPPIDRLIGSLAPMFGVERELLPSFTGTGRSYFITRLMKDVIFQEAGLAGTNLKAERYRAWIQRGAYAGVLALTGLLAAIWLTSYVRNQSHVARVASQTQDVQKLLAALPRQQQSLAQILLTLNAVRDIPGGYVDRNADTPWLMGFGLYQGDRLGGAARTAYRDVLIDVLLPRIILRIEEQLRLSDVSLDYLYEGLRAYLMLGDPKHFDSEAAKAWVELDWDANLPRKVTPRQRQQLLAHLEALFEYPLDQLPLDLDKDLITHVRSRLADLPLKYRVYAQLKRKKLWKNIPDFRVTKIAGPDASRVFVRRSGKDLSDGIPGLYTYDGYHQVVANKSERLAEELTGERWILGDQHRISGKPDSVKRVVGEVHKLYFNDFIEQWDDLLADIEIAPFRGDPKKAISILEILAEPQESPIRRLTEAVERETSLDRAEPVSRDMVEKAVDKGRTAVRELADRIGLSSPEAYVELPTKPTNPIAQHFADLSSKVRAQDDAPTPLDETLKLLGELHAYLDSTADVTGDELVSQAKKQSGGIVGRLESHAKRQPAPLDRWLQALAQGGGSVVSGNARAHLNDTWRGTAVRHFKRALNGRYPLMPDSSSEATLEDFGKFFGPDGLIEAFFRTYLQDVVDTSRDPWRLRRNATLHVSPSALAEFQRAAVIKETFFRQGGSMPVVHFGLKPLSMDIGISEFLLDLDGQQVKYDHGPALLSHLQWPGPGGPSQVSIRLYPPSVSGPSGLTEDGPWAWFKMLDKANITPTSLPERFNVTFEVGGRKALYELRASSALNPFRLRELKQFRCPERL